MSAICIWYPSNILMRFLKGDTVASPFSHLSHKAVSPPYRLLGSRHILTLTCPFHRQSPLGEKSLYVSRHHALSDYMEHHVELSRYYFLVHLGCYSPHARKCERRTVRLKHVYGIPCCCSPSIAFHCLFMHCLCPSRCWVATLDRSENS